MSLEALFEAGLHTATKSIVRTGIGHHGTLRRHEPNQGGGALTICHSLTTTTATNRRSTTTTCQRTLQRLYAVFLPPIGPILFAQKDKPRQIGHPDVEDVGRPKVRIFRFRK
ncbi:hypothetical protein ZHAS_00019258 [Anopheles sinensis]|uniref:Uncharacterized protein n=1 Tax=Anopheles sinensis TaxID=74873 RepID=A0A084WL16_ANOSI|nr:hypothetical protein ZHAS_00019258 [Anopheles sinensis]